MSNGYGDESGISTGGAADRKAAATSTIAALEGVATAARKAPATLRESQAQQNALRQAQFARQQASATPGMAATGGGFSGIGTTQLGMLREQSAQAALDAQSVAKADIAAATAGAELEGQKAEIAFANQQNRTNNVQTISTDMANMFTNRQPPEGIGAYVGAQIGNNFNLQDPDDLKAAAALAVDFLSQSGVRGASGPEIEKFLALHGPALLPRLVSHQNAIGDYFDKDATGVLVLKGVA